MSSASEEQYVISSALGDLFINLQRICICQQLINLMAHACDQALRSSISAYTTASGLSHRAAEPSFSSHDPNRGLGPGIQSEESSLATVTTTSSTSSATSAPGLRAHGPPADDTQETLPSPIRIYLAEPIDPMLAHHLARQSRTSILEHDSVSPLSASRPAAGTSMLLSGNSSLAALTSAPTASTPSSVSSAMGDRALGPPRILELISTGALQVPPVRGTPVFECPFNFTHCLLTFTSFSEWFAHSLSHFGGFSPPPTNRCCFCDNIFEHPDGKKSWKARMEHVALHYQLGHRLAHARPDFEFYRYLWSNRLLDNETFKALVGDSAGRTSKSAYPTPPTSPASSSTSAACSASLYVVTNDPRRRHRR